MRAARADRARFAHWLFWGVGACALVAILDVVFLDGWVAFYQAIFLPFLVFEWVRDCRRGVALRFPPRIAFHNGRVFVVHEDLARWVTPT